ncbi:sensor histidine kinase [Paraglaciecola sp.]|uniref:sensor histidine kinase n=1 Tax=Paraglaciecola sp. TaxID=1920173 RepID=UPI003EF2278D
MPTFDVIKLTLPKLIENQLALMAVVLIEVFIHLISNQNPTALLFLTTFLQLAIECSPILVAHYFAFKYKGKRAFIVWFLGFVIYPTLFLYLSSTNPGYLEWTLFTPQPWVWLSLASLGYGISILLAKRHRTKSLQVISRLLSLNSVLLFLLCAWAFVTAGIFASTDDPLRNQPIQAAIDSEVLIVNFANFLQYIWQFLIIGAVVLSVYWVNRYILIRLVLARSGVLAYISACLIYITLATPILCSVILWLPINIPEFTFLPSGDYNVFSPINYRICFIVLAISAPIILAFERQQQDKALAEIAQRQSQTELQLLQQQINPHFLFNTLNNLYALTLTHSKSAPQLVMQLANLLRYTVYEGQNNRVILAQEIEYLIDFIALQTIRSEDKCQIETHFPEQAEDWKIAPLLLIIILENAFKHGVEPSQKTSVIKLDMQITGNKLTLTCKNSLPENAPKKPSGIGINNLMRRLSLLYSGKHTFVSQQQNNEWFAQLTLEMEPC